MSPKKKVSRAKSKKTASRRKSKRASHRKTNATRVKAAALEAALAPPAFDGFYTHTAVASMVTGLLLNATEGETTFNDVGEQLNAAIDMAKESKLRNADDYLKKVTALRDFWCKSDANKELFKNAHLAIGAWLHALIDQFGDDWVDHCSHVGYNTIKGIFSLK